MTRFLLAFVLGWLPLAAPAQSLSLATLFEEACVAPFELFFGETEAVLRGWGFEVYPNDVYTEFAHSASEMSGAYSANPEDLFCMIHDPRANPEAASRAAQVLLGQYFGQTPQLVPAGTGLMAWGIPYGGCCYLTARISDRDPSDNRQGATISLYLQDR